MNIIIINTSYLCSNLKAMRERTVGCIIYCSERKDMRKVLYDSVASQINCSTLTA